jgi:hypothetical protein
MKNIEFDAEENIVCPFCGTLLLNHDEAESYQVCPHTIFVATDDGFGYIREDLKGVINSDPRGSFDAYTHNLTIDGIRLVQYAPAPSFLGAYWGFVAEEEGASGQPGG